MNSQTLPRHIAIIMDGNGRWAKAKGLPRLEGHRKGVEAAEEIITAVRERKISYLTLYAFGYENWNRPLDEIQGLMTLLGEFLISRREKMLKNGVCFRTIGDTSKLPLVIQNLVAETSEVTKGGKEMTPILALSYGARDEIIRAVNQLVKDYGLRTMDNGSKFSVQGPQSMVHSPIREEDFSKYLDTKDFPDPDLLIRTSGEYRISNYLLWQLAYTELYFTKTMWPDFTPLELDKALEEFSKRERRFGKISEQL